MADSPEQAATSAATQYGRYTPLVERAVQAIRDRLMQTHPSWYKPLALKRRGDEAQKSAEQIAWAAIHGMHGADLLVCPTDGLPPNGGMCGLSGDYGALMEPLACGYPKGHSGDHAWASLPTFVDGKPVLDA